jgi:hypothetical protein
MKLIFVFIADCSGEKVNRPLYPLTRENAADDSCEQRRPGLGVYGREGSEQQSVAAHGVEDSRQREHGAQQAGAEREHRAHRHDPLDHRHSGLREHVRERRVLILTQDLTYTYIPLTLYP